MELSVSVINESIRVIDQKSEFSWKEVRLLQDKSAKWISKSEANIETVNCFGIIGEFITSTSIKGKPKSTVLYFHGGGYCLGSLTSYRKPIANLSKITQSRFLLVDYGLSPEHVFPHALEQAVDVYKWLLARGVDPSETFVMGDSAGGGLATSLLLLIRERGLPNPAGAVLISPWTDMSKDSCMQNEKLWSTKYGPFNSNNLATRFSKAYLGDHQDPKNPLASPYYANLHGLPPLFLMAGGGEALLPDIDLFYNKCRNHNININYDIEEHMPHVYQILQQELAPEVDKSLERIRDFIWTIVQ